MKKKCQEVTLFYFCNQVLHLYYTFSHIYIIAIVCIFVSKTKYSLNPSLCHTAWWTVERNRFFLCKGKVSSFQGA